MARSRPRRCRAIGANVGLRIKYRKTLVNLMRDYQRFLMREIFRHLDAQGLMAEDAFRPQTPEERAAARRIRRLMLSKMARENPGTIRRKIDEFIAKNLHRWQELLKKQAARVCDRFVQKLVASVTASQRQAFSAAGVNRARMDEAWTVPIVQRQHISAQAAQVMPDMARANVDLITRIGADDVARISEVVTDGLARGLNYDDLRDELRDTEGFDEARVNRVVIDQTNKISQQVQRLNAQAVGCERAIWVHVPGEYTSRETHIAMDGQEFTLSEGMFDPDERIQRNVQPGELPFCRCVCRMIFPETMVNDDAGV